MQGGEDDHGTLTVEFTPSKGLTDAQAEELILKYGKNELEEKKKSKVS